VALTVGSDGDGPVAWTWRRADWWLSLGWARVWRYVGSPPEVARPQRYKLSRRAGRPAHGDARDAVEHPTAPAPDADHHIYRRGHAEVRTSDCRCSDCGRLIPRHIRELPRTHSPSLSDPMGAHSSQSSTMPATLCRDMYLSAVMKLPSSRGSCTSRSHPHFSHANDIHCGGSELVIIPTSFQTAAAT
jgi:hypothetical protein